METFSAYVASNFHETMELFKIIGASFVAFVVAIIASLIQYNQLAYGARHAAARFIRAENGRVQ